MWLNLTAFWFLPYPQDLIDRGHWRADRGRVRMRSWPGHCTLALASEALAHQCNSLDVDGADRGCGIKLGGAVGDK